jgi:hypothetical protein
MNQEVRGWESGYIRYVLRVDAVVHHPSRQTRDKYGKMEIIDPKMEQSLWNC